LTHIKIKTFKNTVLVIDNASQFYGSGFPAIKRYDASGQIDIINGIITEYLETFEDSEMIECAITVSDEKITYCQHESGSLIIDQTGALQTIHKVEYYDFNNVKTEDSFEVIVTQPMS